MIKIEEFKLPQHNFASERYLNPKKLYLPLSQHAGKPALICIKAGDQVEESQLIAKENGAISACVHAPKKGRILKVSRWNHPGLQRAECVVMQCENENKNYVLRKDIEDLGKLELLEIIKNSGIVGMGGAAFPTHIKLCVSKEIDTLIINGCECEPFLAADYRLMLENLEEIFKGAEILCRLVKPARVIFAVEENKSEAIKKINLFINAKRFNLPEINFAILKTAYPQGGEKQLIHTLTKRSVPSGKLPVDVGCLVHNVATCFAIYEAVYFNKPLIERLVSFCGDALVLPKNIWIKIGTNLKELFDEGILELKNKPKKIISGGPMMGVSLDSLDYPILKDTGGFLFLRDTVAELAENPCIKCARCVDTCPMKLLPLEYARRVKKENYESLSEFNIEDCVECGCCAYECPAKIPLVHYIKIGKKYKL